jgi:hypothetical protein
VPGAFPRGTAFPLHDVSLRAPRLTAFPSRRRGQCFIFRSRDEPRIRLAVSSMLGTRCDNIASEASECRGDKHRGRR